MALALERNSSQLRIQYEYDPALPSSSVDRHAWLVGLRDSAETLFQAEGAAGIRKDWGILVGDFHGQLSK